MAVNRTQKAKNRKNAPHMLPQLAKKANKHYALVGEHSNNALDAALQCGRALNNARSYDKWKVPKWKEWLERNFDGSYETATIYMRIAKKWDDPELVEARKQGRLTSIQKTMEIIRGKKKHDKKETKPTEYEKKCDQLRNKIRKLHAQKLQRLTVFELDNLLENYDNHWQHMYKKLYDDVCADLECDLNQDLIEMKRLVKPRQPKFSTGTLAQQKQAAERVATFDIKQQEVPSYTTRKKHVEQLEQHKKNVRRKIAKRLNQQHNK